MLTSYYLILKEVTCKIVINNKIAKLKLANLLMRRKESRFTHHNLEDIIECFLLIVLIIAKSL